MNFEWDENLKKNVTRTLSSVDLSFPQFMIFPTLYLDKKTMQFFQSLPKYLECLNA